MHKMYVEKIITKANKEDMIKLEEIFDKAVEHVKECDPKLYDCLELELYEILNGEKLTEDKSIEWVSKMKPYGERWNMEEIKTFQKTYNTNIPIYCMFTIMNMLYNDMKDVLGRGEEQVDIEKYIKATVDWYDDKDLHITGEEKLYRYWKYIAR